MVVVDIEILPRLRGPIANMASALDAFEHHVVRFLSRPIRFLQVRVALFLGLRHQTLAACRSNTV